MSKALPVYELGQWIKSGENYGRIVARMSYAGVFESVAERSDDKQVLAMAQRGPGYCVEWCDIQRMSETETRAMLARTRWLRPDTIADVRYVPCENPTAGPSEPAQRPLALDIEAATEAAMRATSAAGKMADDWLRAKGLMA